MCFRRLFTMSAGLVAGLAAARASSVSQRAHECGAGSRVSCRAEMKRHGPYHRIFAIALALCALAAGTVPGVAGPLARRVTPPARLRYTMPRWGVGPHVPTPPTLCPGLYKAAPFSALVFVPGDVDPQMVFQPAPGCFRMPCLQPPMRLERR